MDVIKKKDGETITLEVSGRLDTLTAPQLQGILLEAVDEGAAVVLDCKELLYVSSAGLRTLIMAQKSVNKSQKKMVLKNVSGDVMEIFEMTGFLGVLTIEE